MCPVHWGKAFLAMLWEDDIRPILIKAVIISVYVFMGIVTGTLVVLFTMLLYRFTEMF